MKVTRILWCFLLIVPILLCGCGSKELSPAKITASPDVLGGGVTVEYNKDRREILVGGEGEVIPFYEQDISRGFTEEGHRVSLKFIAPYGVKEFETGILIVNGKTYSAGEFYQTVNGEKVGEFVVSPILRENEITSIKITWQDGTKEQVYKVIVKPETIFEKAK